jgi:osmotically-inducible protein OsmY
MTITIDSNTCDAVTHELNWDPKVDASRISVAAHDGAVVLSGEVPTLACRWASVSAAERVYGVRAVADEIGVTLQSADMRDDLDLATSIARQLEWHSEIPASVKAEVQNGHITLHGPVTWKFQRDEAARVIHFMTGVNDITNLITLTPPHTPRVTDVEAGVGRAIERMADLDARSIQVAETDGRIQLRGHVHSFSEKKAASRAAAGAPGVTAVDNDIVITP